MAQPTKPTVSAANMEEAIALKLATQRQMDAEYMKRYRPTMLKRWKDEPQEPVYASEAYAPYFGTVWTVLFNLIPITVKFDGTEQMYPKSVARFLRKKIAKTTKVNIPRKDSDESKY